MTTANRFAKSPKTPGSIRLPDPEPFDLDMTTHDHVLIPGYPVALAEHLGNPETTIITSEIGASLRPTTRYADVRFPDLLIAFNVNPDARKANNGYIVTEQGKPPDFVLEVASESNARYDETDKRDYYAAIGVREYWRFDPTGGQWYVTGLAGDLLVAGRYRPMVVNRTRDGNWWGRSPALGLDLCWENHDLRWWDPVGNGYLETHREVIAARSTAQVRAAAAETRATAAEEEARQLREQLRQLRSGE